MKIGKYFTYNEMIHTSTGLENTPMASELNSLLHLVENVLDPLREMYGKPITVNSGYRNPIVNLAIGGANTSQHIKGEAADIKCNDNTLLFNLIKDSLEFDQLIWEKGNDVSPQWVHVSFKMKGNRKDILKYTNGVYEKYKLK